MPQTLIRHRHGGEAMSFQPNSIQYHARIYFSLALAATLLGCAKVSVTPKGVDQPNPAVVADALKAEPTVPTQLSVHDFTFYSSSFTANRAPHHPTTHLLRSRS